MSPQLLNNIRLFEAVTVERQAHQNLSLSLPSCQKYQKTPDCNVATTNTSNTIVSISFHQNLMA